MSKTNPKHNLDGDPDETASGCAMCSRPNHDESQMVFCNSCQQWFYFSCVGVDSAVEQDEEWSCSNCREKVPSTGKEDMDKALKEATEKRKRMQQDMERKLKLAQMEIDLENEKREMQWAMEKKIIEMKIANERAFNKKKEAERKKLQQDWDQLVQQRTRELEKKTKKSKSNKARKEDTVDPEAFDKGHPSNSTPKAKPGSSQDPAESTQSQKILKKDRQALPEFKKQGENMHDDANGHESSTSESESSVGSSVHSEEDRNVKTDAKIPTKSQLSARQFLSRKLPTFTGRPEDWPMFCSSFETTTKACGFSNLENLARLQESLRGAARDAVSSRLLLPDSVPQVMETLRMLYGRPEQLLLSWRRSVSLIHRSWINLDPLLASVCWCNNSATISRLRIL